MLTTYTPTLLPQEYDQVILQEELQKIANFLVAFEVPIIILTPQHVAPTRTIEGMVVNADGTNWNPGAGAGVYEYVGGAWSKL